MENVDPQEEKEWGEKMMVQRKEFLTNKDKESEIPEGTNGEAPTRPKPRGRGKSKTKAEVAAALLKPSKRGAIERHAAEREFILPFVDSEGDHGEGMWSSMMRTFSGV